MIEVTQLTKRYGEREAVRNATFRVGAGEVVGFLGPNGAGKTTTLRMITGYVAPSGGSIRVDGEDVITQPLRARQRMGYMPEGVPLYPEMRVGEYLRHRARIKGVPGRKVRAQVARSLELAAVGDARDRILGQLSKGYRQRVGLADALVADPPILILDEPTAGLDPNQIRHVRALVREFIGEKTVFLSTHILPEVEATCSRVIIIHQGQIVEEGAPDELRRRGGGPNVSLVGRGEAAALRSAVEAVDGVESIVEEEEVGPSLVRLRLATRPDEDVAERIFRAVAEAGLTLRELHPAARRLEDVFAQLTTQDAASSDPSSEEGS